MEPIVVNFMGLRYIWNGGHTVNIYRGQKVVDCFTFGWENNNPTEDEFFDALRERWSYEHSNV